MSSKIDGILLIFNGDFKEFIGDKGVESIFSIFNFSCRSKALRSVASL